VSLLSHDASLPILCISRLLRPASSISYTAAALLAPLCKQSKLVVTYIALTLLYQFIAFVPSLRLGFNPRSALVQAGITPHFGKFIYSTQQTKAGEVPSLSR
jgi:hypothetical protein